MYVSLRTYARRDPYQRGAQAYNLRLEEQFLGKIPKGWSAEMLSSRLQALKTSFFDAQSGGGDLVGGIRGASGGGGGEGGGGGGGGGEGEGGGGSVGHELEGDISSAAPRARRRGGRLQQAYMLS